MTSKINWIRPGLCAAGLAATIGAVNLGHAATYNLVATPFDKAMPDGSSVPMWGFALDGASCPSATPCAATAPGPELVIPPGDTTLTVNLRNNLPPLNPTDPASAPEPVSIVIPGQLATMTPVTVADSQLRQRVRSFTAEAAPGGTQTYTWSNLKPGTYLYHSGTHPQVQVQMGLYGAVKHDAALGGAYPNVAYDSEATLLYSEIDPVLHRAVSAGRYGQPVPAVLPVGLTAADYPTSTVDYSPRYFLVNGNAYATSSAPVPAGSVGGRTLVRFLNAGLRTQTPMLQGQYLSLVAEDGNPYPYAKEQYSVTLPALKTVDAMLSPTATGSYPIYNRRLDPGGTAQAAGGMLAYLQVAAVAPGTPLAIADTYAATEDTQLTAGLTVGLTAGGLPGVLGNDQGTGLTSTLDTSTTNGTLSLNPDGSFTYTPAANFSGNDSFTYRATSGTLSSPAATVTIQVAPVNDAPVAANDSFKVVAGGSLNVAAAAGVLGNDVDPDGDPLTAQLVSGPATGFALNPDGSVSYTAPATAGTYRFTYTASDGLLSSNVATGTITVARNSAPVAMGDTMQTKVNTPVLIKVLANDYDPDAPVTVIDPTTVRLPRGLLTLKTAKGGIFTVDQVTGDITYTPRLGYRGGDSTTYTVKDTLGAISKRATIKVNVVR